MDEFIDQNLDRETSTLVAELIRPFIVTNQVVDQAATELAREAARAAVAPVQVSFTENQIIIEEGKPITAEAPRSAAGIRHPEHGLELGAGGRQCVLLAVLATAAIAAGCTPSGPG